MECKVSGCTGAPASPLPPVPAPDPRVLSLSPSRQRSVSTDRKPLPEPLPEIAGSVCFLVSANFQFGAIWSLKEPRVKCQRSAFLMDISSLPETVPVLFYLPLGAALFIFFQNSRFLLTEQPLPFWGKASFSVKASQIGVTDSDFVLPSRNILLDTSAFANIPLHLHSARIKASRFVQQCELA